MLEKLKGYMKDRRKYYIFLLILLLVFYIFGYIENFDYSYFSIVVIIIYFWIMYIYYHLSLVIILGSRGKLIKGDMLGILLSIIVNEIIQIYMMLNFWEYDTLSKSLLNILIILIPYIMMLGMVNHNLEDIKAIIISFAITIIVYVLLPYTENKILIITIYNLIYLFISERIAKIKDIKVVLIGTIFMISLFYLGFLSTKRGIVIEEDGTSSNYGTGICFTRVGIFDEKKRICGEMKEGEKEGRWIEWHDTGEKAGEGIYRNGKKEGKWIYLYKNGMKGMEITYKNGEEMERKYWNESKNSLREGKYIEYYENGQKESEVVYKAGKREGKYIEYYENGQKYYEGTYVNGKKEGKWIEWYENGQKAGEGNFKNNIGVWIEYDINGKKQEEGIYKGEKKEGKWIKWDSDGNNLEILYKDGRKIEEE